MEWVLLEIANKGFEHSMTVLIHIFDTVGIFFTTSDRGIAAGRETNYFYLTYSSFNQGFCC